MTTRQSRSRSKRQDSGLPSYLDVPPRFGTLRNFNNPTRGPRMAVTARLMGTPFMPWQQYVADVMGEVDPSTGISVYREGYITCMRQVGKTRFIVTYKATVALDTSTPVMIQFAAQEGKSAIRKLVQHAEEIKHTPLGRMLDPATPVTTNGKEHVTWTNGSTEWPLTGKPDSGHGDTIAAGFITEAMAHRDDRYITAMQPAMNTNPSAQMIVESTQGDATSIYWNEQTAELRERFAASKGDLGRIAFFDWSFSDDDDPFAEDTWRRRIPSIGHTLRIEEVRHAADNATTPKKIRAFKRNFGNIANLGAGEEAVFDEDAWSQSETGDIIAGPRTPTLDITNDRSWASIGWAGPNTVGLMQSELIAHERSTHWIIPFLRELFERNPRMPRRVYCAPGGQAALMADALDRAGIELVVLSTADYAAACADYFDGITATDELEHPAPTIMHGREKGQLPLHVAVAGAAWTKGKARTWDTLHATTILSPLVAVSIGPWAYRIEQDRTPVHDILQTIA